MSANGFGPVGMAGRAPARVLIDKIEALPSEMEPSWASGLPVVKC